MLDDDLIEPRPARPVIKARIRRGTLRRLDRKRRSRLDRLAIGTLQFTMPTSINQGVSVPSGKITVAVMDILEDGVGDWIIRGLVMAGSNQLLNALWQGRSLELFYSPSTQTALRFLWAPRGYEPTERLTVQDLRPVYQQVRRELGMS